LIHPLIVQKRIFSFEKMLIMENILIALAIGVAAGIVDVTPMIIMKLDKTANWSAFVHWVVLGLIIPFVHWNIDPWLKGLIIGELTTLPVMIIVAKNDKKSLIPMVFFSAILGIGVAIAGSKFIG
jgi:hypothetical protein